LWSWGTVLSWAEDWGLRGHARLGGEREKGRRGKIRTDMERWTKDMPVECWGGVMENIKEKKPANKSGW